MAQFCYSGGTNDELLLPTPTWTGAVQVSPMMHTPNDSLSGRTYWSIDAGAPCNMTACKVLLANILSITPISIDLPNRSQTIAICERTVYLSSSMTLTHVLYVPNLTVNLLFVSQLLDTHLYYSVYFPKWICVIQDHTTRKAIGACRPTNGVFYFSVHMLFTHLWLEL